MVSAQNDKLVAKNVSTMYLASAWQRRLQTSSPSLIRKNFSPREFGQLKMLRRRFGNDSLNVINWAFDNWQTFSWQAQLEAGLSSAPGQPHIGFLLAHSRTVANMMWKSVPEQIASAMAEWSKDMED